jgi:hypothetical protein
MRKVLYIFFILINSALLIGAEVVAIRPIATSEFGLCTKIRGVVTFIQYVQVDPAPKGSKGEGLVVPYLNFSEGVGDKAKVLSIYLSGFTRALNEQIHDKNLNGKTVELIGYETVVMRGTPNNVAAFPEISGILPSDTGWTQRHTFVVMNIIVK